MRVLLATLSLFVASLMLTTSLQAAELTLHPRIKVSTPYVALNTEVKNWLAENPVIDVGIWGPSHPPIGEGMAHGFYQGMAADYLATLENSLQVRFRLHYYPESSDALAALSRHEVQMLAMWNAERWPSPAAVASSPWLRDKSVLLVRDGDESSPATLANVTLGMVSGDVRSGTLRKDYPGSLLRYFPEFELALNALTYENLDALWINQATASYLMRYYQISGLKTIPSNSLPNLNLSFGIDRQLPQLESAINSVLQQMTLVSRMRIANGWGLDRSAVLTRNPLGLDPAEEQWLQSHPRIPVIFDTRQAPVSFLDSEDEPTGFIVDVLDTLTQRYGVKFTLLTGHDAASLQALRDKYPEALEADRWVVNAFGASLPLLDAPMVVVMKSGVMRPAAFADLKGEKLAISADNPLIPRLETWYPAIKLVKTDSLDEGLELINTDQVRGVIAPQFIATWRLKLQPEYRVAVAVSEPVTHLVLNANDPASLPLKIVTKALTDIPPSKMIELAAPWHQPPDVTALGISERQLWNTLLWGLLSLLILLVSGVWIRRLYRALRQGQRSQEALADQLNFTRALIDNTPIALYARDRQGRLLHANQQWQETVNRDAAPFVGTTIADITSVQPEARKQLEGQYRLALEQGETQYWSGPFLFGDETHYLQGWTVPWRDNRGNVAGLIGGWLDISDKQTLIEHLTQAKAELEKVSVSKAAFMQSMGHEIRTPLNAIIGLLEMELQVQKTRQTPSENLPLIWESATHLQSLIGDVFDIFRADDQQLRGMVRSVNLPQLIESTVALYRLQAEEKGIEVVLETALKNENVEADPLLVIRIFSSLLRNAIKHSQGNVISIALFQGRQQADSLIPIVIEVHNDGVMWDPEHPDADPATLAAEPDAKASWLETGINLTNCQQMAQENGAELGIESDEESGTTLSFYFSVQQTVLQAAVPLQKKARQLRVLVVDDYPPGRRALQQQLESWGHQVMLAENGEQAMACWQQQRGSVDLMITDCTMPVLDGFMLTEMIRQQEREDDLTALPIFGLTALSGFEVVTHCLEVGMNECLTKPLAPQALQVMLQRYFPENDAESVSPVAHENDSEFKREILSVNQQDAMALRDALNQQDVQTVGHIAHRLRGGAGLLKADALFNACQVLEAACEHQIEWQEITLLTEVVFVELNKANVLLSQEMGGN